MIEPYILAEMERCGAAEHKGWRDGVAWIVAILGHYDPTKTFDEVKALVNERMENDRLIPEAQEAYWRGWQRV